MSKDLTNPKESTKSKESQNICFQKEFNLFNESKFKGVFLLYEVSQIMPTVLRHSDDGCAMVTVDRIVGPTK